MRASQYFSEHFLQTLFYNSTIGIIPYFIYRWGELIKKEKNLNEYNGYSFKFFM
tara:strand:+ start:486 stop:647 length:162 start_codon:yes stop_codon:yes gene_type:complete